MTWPWYLLLDAGLWLITLAVIGCFWPRLDAEWRRGACLAACVVMVLQVGNELLSLNGAFLRSTTAWSGLTFGECRSKSISSGSLLPG
jgi:hypothetical protein